jgi:hypothetical protein
MSEPLLPFGGCRVVEAPKIRITVESLTVPSGKVQASVARWFVAFFGNQAPLTASELVWSSTSVAQWLFRLVVSRSRPMSDQGRYRQPAAKYFRLFFATRLEYSVLNCMCCGIFTCLPYTFSPPMLLPLDVAN